MAQKRRGAMLAEARDLARSVGETTIGVARDLAGGARDAAAGVARTTQGAATQVVGKVRENPWPALLVGAGATWMILDATRERLGSRGGRHTWWRRRRRGAKLARGAVSAVAGAGRSVVDAGRSVGARVEQFVRDNPLVAGTATVGLGVTVGLAMPSRVAGNGLLGEARERVARRAEAAARGTMRNVRDIAKGAQRLAGRS